MAAGRPSSIMRSGSKPPLAFATPEHLLGQGQVDLRSALGAGVSENRRAGRAGLENLAVRADFGLEDQVSPALAKVFGDLALLAQSSIELAEHDPEQL